VRGETVTAAAFSADGSRLLTGASDARVVLWQLAPLEQRARWKLPQRSDWKRAGAYLLAVGFAPGDRDYLAIGADGIIHRLAEAPR
jgi:WD40 repeat protein